MDGWMEWKAGGHRIHPLFLAHSSMDRNTKPITTNDSHQKSIVGSSGIIQSPSKIPSGNS